MAENREQFARPDDNGPITTCDLAHYERLRVITDAHTFIVPMIWLGAALLVFLTVRFLFGGAVTRMRRLAVLWVDAKEAELRARK